MNEKTNLFLKWFNDLDESDQSDVIDLAYDEFKVRGLVEGFTNLSPEQRDHLFERLQIPRDVQDKLFSARS